MSRSQPARAAKRNHRSTSASVPSTNHSNPANALTTAGNNDAGPTTNNADIVNDNASMTNNQYATETNTAPTISNTSDNNDREHHAAKSAAETYSDPAATDTQSNKTSIKAFEGTTTGFGTVHERPEDATLDEQWHCGNRSCTTGQTWKTRDGSNGSNGFGRKVISNFFGRNKKQTSSIDVEVWHQMCRKCYQRQSYVAHKSNRETCRFSLSGLETQLDRFMLWRPEAKFTVQLSKGARDRLGQYFKELSKHNDKNAAKAAMYVPPKTKEKNGKTVQLPQSLDDAFDIEQMQHFDDAFCNNDPVDLAGVRTILRWISDRNEAGQIVCMPPVEFLINNPADGETINDASNNYRFWCALDDAKRAASNGPMTSGDGAETGQESSNEHNPSPGDSQRGMQAPNHNESDSTTHTSSDDDELASEQTVPPSPRRYHLHLVSPHNGPLSSTFGAIPGSGIKNPRRRPREPEGDEAESSKRPCLELPDSEEAIESIEPVPATVAAAEAQYAPVNAANVTNGNGIALGDRLPGFVLSNDHWGLLKRRKRSSSEGAGFYCFWPR